MGAILFYYLDQEVAWPSQGCALAEPSPGTQLLLSLTQATRRYWFFHTNHIPGHL